MFRFNYRINCFSQFSNVAALDGLGGHSVGIKARRRENIFTMINTLQLHRGKFITTQNVFFLAYSAI